MNSIYQQISDLLFTKFQATHPPYLIGVTGSVAVGKSTTSRILFDLLSQWPDHPKVALINTDGFLLSGATLTARDLMSKKGFPESYDDQKMQAFLQAIKNGEGPLTAPIYSHRIYDLTGEFLTVHAPDILIMEGLNILQQPEGLFDFIIYIDAPTDVIENWYIERFKIFREQARQDPDSFFHQFAVMSDEDAIARALSTWKTINEANLLQHILPLKSRADVILEKGADHMIKKIITSA